MILSLLGSFFLSFLWGFLLVNIFWPASMGQFGLKIFLASGVGIGVSSCFYFLGLLVFAPADYFWGEIIAICISAGILLFAQKIGRNEGPQPFFESDPVGVPRGVTLFFFYSLFCSGSAFIIFALSEPHGGWDAWAIWNLRARFLFLGGTNWRNGFSPLLEWSHPDYPLLLPASVARSWHYAGTDTLLGPTLISAVFTAVTIGLAASAIGFLRGRMQGYLTGIVLLGTHLLIREGASQLADVPLGFFFLSTFVLITYQQRVVKTRGLSFLAGLSAGFSAWTKNEGLLFLVVVIVAWFTIAIVSLQLRAHLRQIFRFTAGLLPVLIIILYFKAKLAPSNDLVSALGWQTFSKPMHLSSYIFTVRSFFEEILKLIQLLVIYLLFLGITEKKGEKFATNLTFFSVVLMVFGYFVIYIISYQDLQWHINTSLNRLLLQLWPSFVFAFFLFVRSPEEASERNHLR